jgi:G3E family GTPase
MAATDERIPLIIVTGFLGSGKTSLIRHLLADSHFSNAAIVVNEFGEIGIDHHLFLKTGERITLLSDGCACCARRDDLVEALLEFVRRRDRGSAARPAFDRVLLETSGLADPGPILHTVVLHPVLSRRFRVQLTIATLDATSGEASLAAFSEAVRQIAAADVAVLTKGDLASPESAARLARHVADLNPGADVVAADHGRIDVNRLCDRQELVTNDFGYGNHSTEVRQLIHGSSGRANSLSLSFDEPLDWPMFGLWLTMLLHRHGERVLRVKGLLDVGAAGPLLVDGVQHVVHAPRHLPAWPDGDHRSRLVIIARDLEPAVIRASLEAFQDLAAMH